MKQILTSVLLLSSIATIAQPKVISQAVITTKTTIVTPEGMEDVVPSPPPSVNGEEIRRTVRFGGDGETKTVTTLKGDMVKTFTETEMSRTTVLRDNNKKVTTTLMEMMGSKTGFYATDEEMKARAKQMDSLMQVRRQTNNTPTLMSNNAVTTIISYEDESKKIAGLQCKKALLIFSRQNGKNDTNVIWYCPDFKLQGLSTTGGMAGGFGNFGRATTNSLSGLDSLAGFPMQYQMKVNRGSIMTVEVTKINIEKEVADKEFEIPKDFVVKPMKDLQSGGDGRMMIRIGGPGGGGN